MALSADDEKKIQVEVQRLLELAKRLALAAEKLNQVMGTDYAASITALQRYWGGETAAAVVSGSQKIAVKSAETIKGIAEAAKTLEAAAKAYLAAELKAKSQSK